MHQADDGSEIFLEQIPQHQLPFDLVKLRNEAVRTLEAGGVAASVILDEYPGGSALRDFVLNELGHAPDSQLGLAAQVCELAIRVTFFLSEGAKPTQVAALSYRLGWLVAISRIYSMDDARLSEVQQAGADARRVYGQADKELWRELHVTRFQGHSGRRAATLIAAHLKLPEEAVETIRKALAKKTGRPA